MDPERFLEPEKFNVGIFSAARMPTLTSFHPQPDRYLGDNLTNAESANLADPMERDHWMFGAG